jgi:PAS domain S-box-containing protein
LKDLKMDSEIGAISHLMNHFEFPALIIEAFGKVVGLNRSANEILTVHGDLKNRNIRDFISSNDQLTLFDDKDQINISGQKIIRFFLNEKLTYPAQIESIPQSPLFLIKIVKQDNQRFPEFPAGSSVELWERDCNGFFTFQNDLSKMIWGDRIGKRLPENNRFTKEDVEQAEKMNQLACNGNVVKQTLIWRKEGVHSQAIHEVLSPIYENGEVKGVFGLGWITNPDFHPTMPQPDDLLDDLSEMVVLWKPDGTILNVNNAFLEYFKVDSTKLNTLNYYSFIAKDYVATVKEKIAILKQSQPYIKDKRLVRKPNGILAWHEWIDRALIDETGKIYCYQSVGRDIYLENIVLEKLKDREDNLKFALKSASMGIWNWDVIQNHFSVSEDFARNYGLSEVTTIDHFLKYVAPEHNVAINHKFYEALKNPQSEFRFECRYQIQKKDFWFGCRGAVYYRKGQPYRMAGTLADITKRKHSEKAAQEMEEQYSSMIAALAEGIILINSKEEVTTTNYSANEIFGLNFQENPAKFEEIFWNVFHEDGTSFGKEDHPAILTLSTGIPQRSLTLGIVNADDEVVWLSLNCQPVFSDNSNTPAYAVLSFLDITLHKDAEEALKEGEERYRLLFESASEGILMIKDGNILECNPQAQELLGAGLEDVLNQSHEIFFPKFQPDGSLSKKKFTKKITENIINNAQSFEWTYQRLDGSCFDAEISVTDFYLRGERIMFILFRDVTERKKKVAEIRKLALVAKNIDNAVVITNQLGEVEWVNEGFTRITGYNLDEIIGKRPAMFLHGMETDRKVVEKIWRRLKKGKAVKAEIINYNKKGKKFWFEVNIQPIFDEEKVVKYISVQRDITQRKRTEDAIKKQNQMLKKANQELDNFVYSVSHDLRAPITSVLGLIDICSRENDLTEINKYQQLQKKSLLKLDNFIKDILNYSRNSRIELTRSDINFKELLESVFQQYDFMRNSRKINKSIEVQQKVRFTSDERRLSIVLSNLISNSIQFSNPFIDFPVIKVMVKVSRNEALIIIDDNGIGIEAKHQDKIFNMFYRATNFQPGSGLGLYIVKETLDKLKGSITVESELGVGTKFSIKIPNLRK